MWVTRSPRRSRCREGGCVELSDEYMRWRTCGVARQRTPRSCRRYRRMKSWPKACYWLPSVVSFWNLFKAKEARSFSALAFSSGSTALSNLKERQYRLKPPFNGEPLGVVTRNPNRGPRSSASRTAMSNACFCDSWAVNPRMIPIIRWKYSSSNSIPGNVS